MSKRTLAICSAVHTLHDGLSDVTYVLLPLLANAFGLSLAIAALGGAILLTLPLALALRPSRPDRSPA